MSLVSKQKSRLRRSLPVPKPNSGPEGIRHLRLGQKKTCALNRNVRTGPKALHVGAIRPAEDAESAAAAIAPHSVPDAAHTTPRPNAKLHKVPPYASHNVSPHISTQDTNNRGGHNKSRASDSIPAIHRPQIIDKSPSGKPSDARIGPSAARSTPTRRIRCVAAPQGRAPETREATALSNGTSKVSKSAACVAAWDKSPTSNGVPPSSRRVGG